MKYYMLTLIFPLLLAGCNLTSRPENPVSKNTNSANNIKMAFSANSSKGIFSFLTQNHFVPTSIKLASDVANFSSTLNIFCQNPDSDTAQLKAQFSNVIVSFNLLSGAPIGPLTENNDQLRDEITSYPFFNACAVDRHVAGFANNNPPKRILYNQKGLMALDYLLFNSSLETRCPNQSHPDLVYWSTLPNLQKQKFRCNWAQQLTKDLSSQTASLQNKWSTYELELLTSYANRNERELFNLLLASLFRIEFLKNVKIGNAFGIYKDCKVDVNHCPEFIEFSHSDLSFNAIEANLTAFSLLFFGSNTPMDIKSGFAVALEKQGLSSLIKRTQDSLNNAQITLANLQTQGSFNKVRQDLINSNNRCDNFDPHKLDSICALFHWITDLSRITKQDLLLALSLTAPIQHQGDND